ncbi:MAG TPA: glutathione S-transferase family protein [Methyloceanibacter sp.]|jgi:glutathione S-transferase|nr:glutathione S-transferase family protein [Methyloceanibacter sp.]
MTITLYDMQDSPHARKVRLLAAELGIPLTRIERDPRKGETRSADYLAKNPNGRVPTIVEDGFALWESHAILKYLAAKHPERGLGGSDAKQAALIDQWLFWWTGGAEAAIDAMFWETFIKPKILNQPGNDPGIIADAHARIGRFLPVLEKQLEGRDYIVGPLSIVDFAIGPRLDRAPELLKIAMTPYPNILAWRERLRARPYWAAA